METFSLQSRILFEVLSHFCYQSWEVLAKVIQRLERQASASLLRDCERRALTTRGFRHKALYLQSSAGEPRSHVFLREKKQQANMKIQHSPLKRQLSHTVQKEMVIIGRIWQAKRGLSAVLTWQDIVLMSLFAKESLFLGRVTLTWASSPLWKIS